MVKTSCTKWGLFTLQNSIKIRKYSLFTLGISWDQKKCSQNKEFCQRQKCYIEIPLNPLSELSCDTRSNRLLPKWATQIKSFHHNYKLIHYQTDHVTSLYNTSTSRFIYFSFELNGCCRNNVFNTHEPFLGGGGGNFNVWNIKESNIPSVQT
jgi:hypothetical protein